MFMDLELSRRLERAEGMVGISFAGARRKVSGVAAAAEEIGGAIAVFDGADSPMTQTFGLGLWAPVGDAGLAAIEAFFTERGADTSHEVSPFAGVEAMQALVTRGYRPVDLSTVLVQPIPEPAAIPDELRVRVIDPGAEGGVWIDTSIAGWASDPATAAFIRSIAECNIENRAMTHYLVERDGVPIATASLGIHDDVALLAGASTRPEARGQGAQSAVVTARLADARARGCSVAMIVASVGSISQRNAERRGFAVAYTRTKWHRPRA